MKKQWIAILAVLAFAGCSHAKKAPTTAADTGAQMSKSPATAPASTDGAKVSCTKGSETRLLEIITKGKGCSLNYNKAGKMSVVATAAHGSKHCADSQKKIRTKLETAGYKCM